MQYLGYLYSSELQLSKYREVKEMLLHSFNYKYVQLLFLFTVGNICNKNKNMLNCTFIVIIFA